MKGKGGGRDRTGSRGGDRGGGGKSKLNRAASNRSVGSNDGGDPSSLGWHVVDTVKGHVVCAHDIPRRDGGLKREEGDLKKHSSMSPVGGTPRLGWGAAGGEDGEEDKHGDGSDGEGGDTQNNSSGDEDEEDENEKEGDAATRPAVRYTKGTFKVGKSSLPSFLRNVTFIQCRSPRHRSIQWFQYGTVETVMVQVAIDGRTFSELPLVSRWQLRDPAVQATIDASGGADERTIAPLWVPPMALRMSLGGEGRRSHQRELAREGVDVEPGCSFAYYKV